MRQGEEVEKQNGTAPAPTGTEKSQTSSSEATATEYGQKDAVVFDKGVKAWLQVMGAFFMYFNSWYVLAIPERTNRTRGKMNQADRCV